MVTLTNSVSDVARDQIANAGLQDLVDAVYSADEVGRLKPAPEPYLHVLEAQRTNPADAVMVAAHDWDIAGAGSAGLITAFVARTGQIPLPAHAEPDFVEPGLDAIVTRLLSRQATPDERE